MTAPEHAKVFVELCRKLHSDTAFREDFSKDPHKFLDEAGLTEQEKALLLSVDEARILAYAKGDTSREELDDAQLEAAAGGFGWQDIPMIAVGQIDRRLP